VKIWAEVRATVANYELRKALPKPRDF